MDQRQVDEALGRHLMRLNLLALAFCASAVAYVVVAWVLIEMMGFEGLMELSPAVAGAIAMAQLLVILAGYLISRRVRNAAPRPTKPGRDTAIRSAAATDAEEAMQRYAKSVVIASALREVASIVGLLLTLMTGELIWVVVLSAAAILSMLVHWPRRDAVQDFLEQQRVAR